MISLIRLIYHYCRIVAWRQLGFFRVARFMLNGKWEGNLELEWLEPKLWRVMPSNTSMFHRADGTTWKAPVGLETDLASIPEYLWSMPGFSPQWYARSAVIHDAIYQAHHEAGNPSDDSGFDDANALLAEMIYAEMVETQQVIKWRLWAYYESVQRFGIDVWNGTAHV